MSIPGASSPPQDSSSRDAPIPSARPTTGQVTDRQQPPGTQIPAPSEGLGNASKGVGGADAQVIFDERFALFMDQLGTLCDTEDVPVAVAIVCDPKIKQGPLVMTRGHKYDVARVLVQLLRRLKTDMGRELEV